MARPVAKVLTGFFILAAVLLVAVLILTLSQPAPAPPPLPVPNGYDDILRASDRVSGDVWNYPKMSVQELRAVVSKNKDALKLVETGLSRECRVPVDYSPTNSTRIERLAGIKRLAQALVATGRLAEMENRPADAAEAYVTVIQLGSAIGQGGLLIDSLVSIAVEAIGIAPLQKLVPNLDAKQCRAAAAALESCESRREPAATIVAHERAWARRTFGFQGQFVRLFQFRALKQNEEKVTAKVQTHETRVRGLLIQLAARAYELEKGEPAKSLADLVPVYLKAIPQDPLTGTNMAYRP